MEENRMQDELDEMLGEMDSGETAEPEEVLGDVGSSDDAMESVEASTDIPEDEAETDEESVDAPGETGDHETEEPQYVEEEPAEPADEDLGDEDPSDELSALQAQNQALLERIEALSGQVIQNVPLAPKETPASKQEKPAEQSAQRQQMLDFLGENTIDDLLEDPTKFNQVLNNVAAKSHQAAVQHVLQSVPEMVMGYITRHTAMNRLVDDFYKEHPDLANVKQTVAAVANDVHAKNPDLGVEEVFKQSAEQTRKLLGMKQTAQRAVAQRTRKPAFAKKGSGARRTEPKMTGLQAEINDLLSGEL